MIFETAVENSKDFEEIQKAHLIFTENLISQLFIHVSKKKKKKKENCFLNFLFINLVFYFFLINRTTQNQMHPPIQSTEA